MPTFSKPGAIIALACVLFPATLLADPVRDALLQIAPDLTIIDTSGAPVAGLQQVVSNRGVFYVSDDGQYVIAGSLLDVRRQRDLSRAAVEANFGALAQALPGRIRFGPDDAHETLYVFTDTSCGYCVQLHREVPALNARGVAVEYLAWPRAGLEGDTFRAMRGIWCAAEPADAYERVIAGRRGRAGSCDDPIAEHLAFGQQMGVRGTPSIHTADGLRLGGFKTAEALLEDLDL